MRGDTRHGPARRALITSFSAALVAALLTLLGSCLRSGYAEHTAASPMLFTAEEPSPFGGATLDGVVILDLTARLPRLEGFSTRSTRLSEPRNIAAAVGYGDEIYVAGGYTDAGSSACTDKILLFSPRREELTVAHSLPDTRQGMGLLVHPNGLGYAAMGYCGSQSEAEEAQIFSFNHTVALALAGTFPDPVYHFASGALADDQGTVQLVAAGGYGSGPLVDTIQTFDVEADTGQILAIALPSKRCQLAGAVSGDTFFVLGGNLSSNCSLPATATSTHLTAEVVAVRLAPEQVAVVTTLPQATALAAAATREDGTVALFGGITYGAEGQRAVTDNVWVFDPIAGVVRDYPVPLPEARSGMAAATTDGGGIYLLGGSAADGTPRDDIWLFEPYAAAGSLLGPVVDSGKYGARWTELAIDAEVPTGASIDFEIRTAEDPDTLEAPDDGWTGVEVGRLPAELPMGRYLQWRAELRSDDGAASPILTAVRLSFE